MNTKTMIKPVRLELNNSGAWKLLGHFDAADDMQTDEVMNAAEALVKALHWTLPETQSCRTTLRVNMGTAGDTTSDVLMRWTMEDGWRDVGDAT
jgi:hypothetical protein